MTSQIPDSKAATVSASSVVPVASARCMLPQPPNRPACCKSYEVSRYFLALHQGLRDAYQRVLFLEAVYIKKSKRAVCMLITDRGEGVAGQGAGGPPG